MYVQRAKVGSRGGQLGCHPDINGGGYKCFFVDAITCSNEGAWTEGGPLRPRMLRALLCCFGIQLRQQLCTVLLLCGQAAAGVVEQPRVGTPLLVGEIRLSMPAASMAITAMPRQ